MSSAAHAQLVGAAPVANPEPGKPTYRAVELIDYAGLYEFPKSMPLTIVAQDGQLYERFGSDGSLKIEATGPTSTWYRNTSSISLSGVQTGRSAPSA